jgi:hypothetical protein
MPEPARHYLEKLHCRGNLWIVGSVDRTVRLLVGIALIALAACSTPERGAAPKAALPARVETAVRPGWPTSFVSERTQPDGRTIVGVSDTSTGKLRRTLYVSRGGSVSGTAITPTGDVWITINRGPTMLGHVMGGNPQPRSCASTVIEVSPKTGATHVVLRGGNDELIADAQPSPAGDRVAYLHSGCATSYFDNSVQIRDRRSGRVITIGARLPRCHLLFQPRWTADGRHLAVLYGPASTSDFRGAPGTCSQPRASHLVVLSAQQGSSGVAGNIAPVDERCSVNAIAITRRGFAAVEQCSNGRYPEPVFIDGATRLLRYSPTLRILARSALGQCEDGASMAGQRSTDEVVISTYQYCGGYSNIQPVTKVVVASDDRTHQLVAVPGGQLSFDDISY